MLLDTIFENCFFFVNSNFYILQYQRPVL